MKLFQELLNERIIAIIRGVSEEAADPTVEAMIQGGIRLLEVTMNTQGALQMIARWREKYGEQVHVGAGTVLNLSMAKEAVAAGAEFLISPNLDEAVVEFGNAHQVSVWPGVMTPTEIVRAWNAGAEAIKLFPMGTLGIQYLKEIRAPLDFVPIIATGGVNLGNIRDVLQAGAVAVGLGSNLADKKLIASGKFEDLTLLARQYVEAALGGEEK